MLRGGFCALALVLAACGDSPAPPSTATASATVATESISAPESTASTTADGEGTPVTPEQAETLARVLKRNHDAGGIVVEGVVAFRESQTVGLTAEIDFARTRGHVVFSVPATATTRAGDVELYWTERAVIQPDDASRDATGSARTWESVPIRTDGITAHQYIRFLGLLASKVVDNVGTIRVNGAALIGTDDVRGTPVDVYRLKKDGRTIWAVGHDDGQLHRVDADIAGLGPSFVEIVARGPQTIDIPPAKPR